jgi:chromosome segregation ATPase
MTGPWPEMTVAMSERDTRIAELKAEIERLHTERDNEAEEHRMLKDRIQRLVDGGTRLRAKLAIAVEALEEIARQVPTGPALKGRFTVGDLARETLNKLNPEPKP